MSDDQDDEKKAEEKETKARPPAWMQRLVNGASVVVVGGVAIALLMLDPPGVSEAPRLAARVLEQEVRREPDHWVVPFEVSNQGTRPAEKVRVVVSLEQGGKAGGGAPEVDYEFDHLPRGRHARGVAVLYGDRLAGTPVARVEAYQLP